MSITIKRYPFNYFEFCRKEFPLNVESIKNSLTLLAKTSFRLSRTTQLIVAIFFSRLIRIPKVKDISYSINDKTLVLFAYIDKPNWEAEEEIYEVYGMLLDLFPHIDIDLKVLELYGRSIEELELCKF